MDTPVLARQRRVHFPHDCQAVWLPVGGLYLRGPPLDAVVDLMASVGVVLLFPYRR